MKYKIGDKVRIKDKFWELANPSELAIHEGKKRCVGMVLEINSVDCYGDIGTKEKEDCNIDTSWTWHHTWVEPFTKTIDNLEVGDVLLSERGNEAIVVDFSKNNHAVYLNGIGSCWIKKYWWTPIEEIKERGLTLKQDPIVETVEILGKKYKKDEVESRLSELKEI